MYIKTLKNGLCVVMPDFFSGTWAQCNDYIRTIAQERAEQIEKHGRTVEKDVNENMRHQLRNGAIRLIAEDAGKKQLIPDGWGEARWFKMADKTYKDRLIIAGALIAAEIDVLQNKEVV